MVVRDVIRVILDDLFPLTEVLVAERKFHVFTVECVHFQEVDDHVCFL